MCTITVGNELLFLRSFFVVLGFFRQARDSRELGAGSPERISQLYFSIELKASNVRRLYHDVSPSSPFPFKPFQSFSAFASPFFSAPPVSFFASDFTFSFFAFSGSILLRSARGPKGFVMTTMLWTVRALSLI